VGFRAPDRPLTDGKIALRPWQPEDVDPLVEICQDLEVQRFTSVPADYRREDALMFMAQKVAAEQRGDAVSFAIVDARQDRLLGSIDVRRRDDHRASIGYLVAAPARGRGVATRAVRLLSRWALAELPVARLEIHVRPDNPASQAVARRAGFTREGVLRAHLEIKGRRYDSVVFSLLADDVGSVQ
jgi:RimJ/RimL family protein N-acetyltransferase